MAQEVSDQQDTQSLDKFLAVAWSLWHKCNKWIYENEIIPKLDFWICSCPSMEFLYAQMPSKLYQPDIRQMEKTASQLS